MARAPVAPAKLVFTHDTLTPGLKEFPAKMDVEVGKTVDYFAIRAESYARDNAPWTDRTTNARNGLHTVTIHEPPVQHGIILAHSMPYGIWLEVRFEGRYAIILPTIQEVGPELMNGLRGLFGRMN